MSEVTEVSPFVCIKADISIYKAPLLATSPFILLGTARFGLMMAAGRGTSEGSGWVGLVVAVLAVTAPLLGFGGMLALRWANATIVLDDQVLTVRNSWGRRVFQAPVQAIAGLHNISLPLDSTHKDRVVIPARTGTGRPYILNTRLWQSKGLQELWQQLDVPVRADGHLTWSQLRQRFPGARMPWFQRHYVVRALVWMVVGIAYIALVVNLPFLL